MPIPQITFWCGVTYTGPWRTSTHIYTASGYTTTRIDTYTSTSMEFTWTAGNNGLITTSTYMRPDYTTTVTFDTPGYTSWYATTYPNRDFYPDGWDPCVGATIARAVPVALILGLYALGLIITFIVYKKRQRKRKAWYRPMAAYYKGGLPHTVKPRVPGA